MPLDFGATMVAVVAAAVEAWDSLGEAAEPSEPCLEFLGKSSRFWKLNLPSDRVPLLLLR